MSRTVNARGILRLLICCCVSVAADAGVGAQPSQQPAAPCEPRVSNRTLLDGVEVGAGGRLSIGKLYATCLPAPARRSQTAYEYNPYDGGRLTAVLKSSNGQTLNTFVWYGEKITTLWELSRYEVVGGHQSVKPLSPGSYTLEFAVEDKVFQRFPFSVSTVESKDVYRPATIHLLDGPWNDYAEIYFPKPDRYTQLWVWLRDKEAAGLQPKEIQYKLRLVRESDGKLIAEGGGATSAMRLRPEWGGYKLSFRPLAPGPGGSTEFHASEFLQRDGNYRVELSLDGKPYAAYTFAVKGGKFWRPEAEEREAARQLTPLASETNYWTLRRVKSGR